MNGLVNGNGINVEVERNWTWVYGNRKGFYTKTLI